jgi:hypothetical protein
MDIKDLFESADIEMKETLDYLAECLQNYKCSLLTKMQILLAINELKRVSSSALKETAEKFKDK